MRRASEWPPSNADLLVAAALVEAAPGKLGGRGDHTSAGRALDPRSVTIGTARSPTRCFGCAAIRRPSPPATGRIALAPDNLGIIETKTMVPARAGRSRGARAG